MTRVLITLTATAAFAGCAGAPTPSDTFAQMAARCTAAVGDDDLRKVLSDCRLASTRAEQASLGTPALRSDLLLQRARTLRAANAHLPALDHTVVKQIESLLDDSLRREEAATPRDDRRVGLRLMELADFYWTRKRFADGQPYAARLKPLLASYAGDEQIRVTRLVDYYEREQAERTQRAEAVRAARERVRNEFVATIAARTAREKGVPARVEDPGYAIVWCVNPMPIGDSAVVSTKDVERSLGVPSRILSLQGDGAFICENTAAGGRIIAWREWACRGPAASRLQFAACVLTRWNDGVPEALAHGQDDGSLLRSFTAPVQTTVTRSRSGTVTGAVFEPPRWQPRWP